MALKEFNLMMSVLSPDSVRLIKKLLAEEAGKEDIIKREIPRKLNGSRNDWGCPNCDRTIEYKYKYCPHCGQKFDWSGKNDDE